MNKIAIVGSGGSGKSTLSRELSLKLNIPVYHLDSFFWKPGWKTIDKTEWFEINDNLVSKDKWIIDGNYKSTMSLRMEYADTIIFLDFSRIVCMINSFKRYFQYRRKSRLDMTEGCFERIDFQYWKWIWIYPKKFRPVTLKKYRIIW